MIKELKEIYAAEILRIHGRCKEATAGLGKDDINKLRLLTAGYKDLQDLTGSIDDRDEEAQLANIEDLVRAARGNTKQDSSE